MWKIKQIAEADFGCEERMPGEVVMCVAWKQKMNG